MTSDTDRVISGLRDRLDAYPKETRPIEHATVQFNLGLAHAEAPTGDRNANLGTAIKCYAEALSGFSEYRFPVERARVLNALGSAERDLGSSELALERFEQADRLVRAETAPAELGAINNNIGLVLTDLGRIEEAEAAFEKALEHFDTRNYARQRMATLHNLGQAQAAGGGLDGLTRARDTYRQGLDLATGKETLYLEAMIRTSLGIVLSSVPEDRAPNLSEAIGHHRAALQVFDQLTYPFQHAVTNNNLGVAYLENPDVDPVDLLRAAACFESVLRIFDPRIQPHLWREARVNLDRATTALSDAGLGDDRIQHHISLAAAIDDAERLAVMRPWLTAHLRLPPDRRQEVLVQQSAAIVALPENEQTSVTTTWMAVLMEQPQDQLDAALRARMQSHLGLKGDGTQAALRSLDAALGQLEILQRVAVRDRLADLGYKRPGEAAGEI